MAAGDSQGEVVALGVVFMLLPMPFVTLRFYWRYKSNSATLLSDWLMIPALLLLMLLCTVQIFAAYRAYLGQHQPTGNDQPLPEPLELMKKCVYIFLCVDKLMAGFVKISIILLYRSIFSVKKYFRWLNNLALSVVALWILIVFPMNVAICRPPSIFWGTNLELLKTKCFDHSSIYLATVLPDFLTDVMVLLLPMPQIVALNMSQSQKISLTGIFLLGGFVLATGAIRIWVFTQTDFNWVPGKAVDVSWGAAPAIYWTTIHGSISIVCACLPTLRGLVRDWETHISFRRRQQRMSRLASPTSMTTLAKEVSSPNSSPRSSTRIPYSQYDRRKFDESKITGHKGEYCMQVRSETPRLCGRRQSLEEIHVWHEATVEESEREPC